MNLSEAGTLVVLSIIQAFLFIESLLLLIFEAIVYVYPKLLYGIDYYNGKGYLLEYQKSREYDFHLIGHKDEDVIVTLFDKLLGIATTQGLVHFCIIAVMLSLFGLISSVIGLLSNVTNHIYSIFINGLANSFSGIVLLLTIKYYDNLMHYSASAMLNKLLTRFDPKKCHICYKKETFKVVDYHSIESDIMMLAFDAYKCCGVDSYEDVKNKDKEIPRTCCDHGKVKGSTIMSGAKCKLESSYIGCMHRLKIYLKTGQVMKHLQSLIVVSAILFFTIAIISLIYSIAQIMTGNTSTGPSNINTIVYNNNNDQREQNGDMSEHSVNLKE